MTTREKFMCVVGGIQTAVLLSAFFIQIERKEVKMRIVESGIADQYLNFKM